MESARLTRQEAIRRLEETQAEVRALGVGFAPGATSFDRLLALADLLEERLGRRVEVVTTETLLPFIGPRILAEAEDVFRAA